MTENWLVGATILLFIASSMASIWSLGFRNVIMSPAKTNQELRRKRDLDTKVNGALFGVIAMCSLALLQHDLSVKYLTLEEVEEMMPELSDQEPFRSIINSLNEIDKRVQRIEEFIDPPGSGMRIFDELKKLDERLDALSLSSVTKAEFGELREIVSRLREIVESQQKQKVPVKGY